MDVAPKYLPEDASFYMLNNETNLSGANGTLGKSTPMAANEVLCEMEQPGGENYTDGAYYSILTKEAYDWVYNSNGTHYIKRVNADGSCQVVYHDPCLELSADPKHAMQQWRGWMRVEKVCANRHGKYLVWANGLPNIGYLDVEASIATNNFSTPFFQKCGDPCAYWQLCVPQPCGCLNAEWVPLPSNEVGLTNKLVDVGVKLMFRHVYYDLRASEWSDRSSLYFQDSKGCFDNSAGFSRCLKVRIPVGNPMVDKIEIGFSIDNGVTWSLYDTVEKYKKYNSSQQYWYEREFSEDVASSFSEVDCAFDYIFCRDKECTPIDPVEITRVNNPIPREAQGLIPIKNAVGFYNYKSGNCPVDQTQIEKLTVALNCESTDCEADYATVTVRAVIYNFAHDRMQFIYRLGGENDSVPDDLTDTAFFGGLNPSLDGGFETGYDQQFRDKTRNFIAYIEGTDSWAVMKQWYSDDSFSRVYETGIISSMDDVNTRNRFRRAARNGEYLYQEGKIRVRKGTKGFIRLASQKATGNEQDTSTFVVGILDDIRNYKGNDVGDYDSQVEEIYFDTCNGDVELFEAFVIQDNAVDEGFATKASAYYGYITDANGRPVEGQEISVGGVPVSRTDHNGFYHFYKSPGTENTLQVDIQGEKGCFTSGGFDTIQAFLVSGQPGANTQKDAIITSVPYKDGFYAVIKQPVVDCDGQGIGGVRVAISGSKYAVTDGTGVATFRIRNYNTRDRYIRTVLLDDNGCFSQDCAGACDTCMPTNASGTTACYQTKPEITMVGFTLNVASATLNKRGLKAGGNYPFAAVVQFDCGKLSAAYPINSLNIPKTQDKNKLSFCTLSYNGTGMELPAGAQCVKIVRGVNLNDYELQWIVDKIERTANSKIKLTIQSLNDYNARYQFKTNTVYQWLKNDRVEFIRNGDGKILTTAANGLLNYLTVSPFNDEELSGVSSTDNANYFNQLLIEDDGRLDSLTEGATIELQRPKECTVEPTYYEICASIPVGADNKPKYPTGNFTSFDTFLVQRQIGTNPVQTFEHKNPSDFWGADGGMSDIGKAHFANQYENERRFGRNISINAPGQFNYFGDLVKTFDAPEQGDITAMNIVDGQIILAIGEYDSFLAQASNDLVKVGSDGIIRAAAPESVISDAQPKLSGQFGCQYPHIGSIFFGDGFARFCDVSKGADVLHDYQEATDISIKRNKTYFKRRFQEIELNNRSESDFLNHYRFMTGLNKTTGALALTIKKLRHPATNNDKKAFVSPNSTILLDPKSVDYLGFHSLTPDAYVQMDAFDDAGCAFISYFNGVPYLHPSIATKFNEFCGVAVDRVVGVAMHTDPRKIIVPISGEIQDDIMWFVHEVTTPDVPTFRSEVPPIKVKKDERKWNFNFLNNINSRGGLFSGDKARDYAVCVTLVRDNTDALKYGTINEEKRVLYDELDMIIFKFMLSEQSGMTENL